MKNKGFTLVELLVVIGIIGVLSMLITAGVRIAREKAKITKAQHDVNELYTAISVLANDTNSWPGHQPVNVICSTLPGGCPANNEICDADAADPSQSCPTGKLSDPIAGLETNDGTYAGWNGPYMNKVPVDAWGHEYFFDTDYSLDVDNNPCGCGGGGCTDAVVIGSYGPDGLGVPDDTYGCDDIIKIIAK
jgi:prepilin-type N-terminal cleavage/methylation domain-containing protein